ncbi:V(D)J recombination activating protein 2 isoform 2 [Hibiscus syriacus]|uniref:V(D)J recombination activating protein 2 isoform 2 n=1 Tax=Hibiscus syriacus TaxID=106335 RepID=A0A6A2Y944_HIBSY|nr:V(D)J recombination activating protein 2 isoform 2 [Hibiscus syriacus]
MAVAAAGAVTVTTAGVRLLSAPRTLDSIRTSSFVTTASYSKLGFSPVRIRNNEPARKKLLVIRASRTESQGVSLGSRAPNFQLPEPLTGKTWTLEDFESYPALLQLHGIDWDYIRDS